MIIETVDSCFDR